MNHIFSHFPCHALNSVVSWLRHCDKSRKVADMIPDGVIWIFSSTQPSGRTMALWSTQPLTAMNARNIAWRVKAAGA